MARVETVPEFNDIVPMITSGERGNDSDRRRLVRDEDGVESPRSLSRTTVQMRSRDRLQSSRNEHGRGRRSHQGE